jgi:hypothetical protein
MLSFRLLGLQFWLTHWGTGSNPALIVPPVQKAKIGCSVQLVLGKLEGEDEGSYLGSGGNCGLIRYSQRHLGCVCANKRHFLASS